MNKQILMGCTRSHLEEFQSGVWLHCDVVDAVRSFQAQGQEQGFDIQVASAYRSFERQLAIWNDKATGKRAVLDSKGMVIPAGRLSDEALMWSILRWSALPGTSRHHWGTDLDVFDGCAVDENYQLQLVVDEYTGSGPFASMSDWFETVMSQGQSVFYRPYAQDNGGVAPEPWHISYRPLAEQCEQQLNEALIRTLMSETDIQLKEFILPNLSKIMDRFVLGC